MANPTTNLNITLPEPGAESSRGTWGTSINDAISDLDVGIADRGVPAGGTDDQILTKNGTDDYATEWATRLSSVGITGTDGIEVDSGSPVTTAGSITLGINKTTLLSYLNAEDGATADQTASEVKTLYENNSDTNAFSDAEQTKLSGIETSATADQTAAEIKSLYESNSNTSVASATTATTATTAIEVAVVDESADTTCFPLFVATATGSVQPKSGTNLTFNSNTGALNSTSFHGDLTGDVTGTATTATNVTASAGPAAASGSITGAINLNGALCFSSANHGIADNDAIVFTSNGASLPTGITAGTTYYKKVGDSSTSGSANFLAGAANNFHVSTSPGGSNISGSVNHSPSPAHSWEVVNVQFPLFALDATGNVPPKTRTDLTFSTSGVLTAPSFAGSLTGSASAIADGIVSEAKLHVSNAPTDGYVLTARSAAAGDMTWEATGSGSFEPLGTAVAMAIALG